MSTGREWIREAFRFDALLVKPVAPESLVDAVERLLPV